MQRATWRLCQRGFYDLPDMSGETAPSDGGERGPCTGWKNVTNTFHVYGVAFRSQLVKPLRRTMLFPICFTRNGIYDSVCKISISSPLLFRGWGFCFQFPRVVQLFPPPGLYVTPAHSVSVIKSKRVEAVERTWRNGDLNVVWCTKLAGRSVMGGWVERERLDR